MHVNHACDTKNIGLDGVGVCVGDEQIDLQQINQQMRVELQALNRGDRIALSARGEPIRSVRCHSISLFVH